MMKLYWWPKLVDKETVDRLRDCYPEEATLSDERLLEHFGYQGHKYEAPALWDHVGDAEYDYNKLADALLATEAIHKASRID